MSSKKLTNCKICNIAFSKVGNHVYMIHKLSRKEYYDTYIKKDDEGICKTCGDETTLYHYGYAKFCSSKCSANNADVKLAIKNSVVMEKRVATFKQTLKNNPEIQENINVKIKQWAKNNPDKVKQRNKNITKTYKDNPAIVKNRITKQRQTLKDNPIIVKNRIEKYKEWYSNNPKKVEQKHTKQSISVRNTYNKMFDKNSTLSYYLYIVKNHEKNIIKIGISNNPKKRLNKIITDYGASEIIHLVKNKFYKIASLEIYLHEYFNTYCKVQPKGVGRTEWFDKSILEETLLLISSYNFDN